MSDVLFDKPIVARAGRSAELDHFYVTEFTPMFKADVERIARKLTNAYIIAEASRGEDTMSTVQLLDGYHLEGHSKNSLRPVEVLERLRAGADMAGVTLDYVMEEGGFVRHAPDVLKDIRLTAPQPHDSYVGEEWVHAEIHYHAEYVDYQYGPNAKSIARSRMAMQPIPDPEPENSFSSQRYDIQVFDYKRTKSGNIKLNKDGLPEINEWACPYLAGMSTMARLGIRNFADPQLIDDLPDYDNWSQYPLIMQLNPDAAPFQAERIFNVLPHRYLPVEVASRLLVGAVDRTVFDRTSYYIYPDGSEE